MKILSACSLLLIVASFPLSFSDRGHRRSSLQSEALSSSVTTNQSRKPNIEGLKLVTQLPAELPQRISALAFDGKNIWVGIYLGRGHYATLDPRTLSWKISDNEERHKAIKEVAGAFESPGALCFVGDKLWVAGSYGESFGYIDTQDWKVQRIFKGKQRDDKGSQGYAGMAYDESNLWIAWHWFNYKLPASQTQLLLKVDPETGKVIGEYPLPAGSPPDGVHGLTWDGINLWHMKDSKLSSIDSSNGLVVGQYTLDRIKRPSGLAWDGEALWIAEFDGKIWRLPF